MRYISLDECRNQRDMVLAYIQKYGSITALEAVRDLGILQLSSRICELQKRGVVFSKTPDMAVSPRTHKKVRFLKYGVVYDKQAT